VDEKSELDGIEVKSLQEGGKYEKIEMSDN
jgi:hypothetical protein